MRGMLTVEQSDEDADIQKGAHGLDAFLVTDSQHIVCRHRWAGAAGNRSKTRFPLKALIFRIKLSLPKAPEDFLDPVKLLRAQLAQSGFDFGDAHDSKLAAFPSVGKPFR